MQHVFFIRPFDVDPSMKTASILQRSGVQRSLEHLSPASRGDESGFTSPVEREQRVLPVRVQGAIRAGKQCTRPYASLLVLVLHGTACEP